MNTGMSSRYELVTSSPAGKERVQQYASEEPLTPGAVFQLRGRFWLVKSFDEAGRERPVARRRKAVRLRFTASTRQQIYRHESHQMNNVIPSDGANLGSRGIGVY